MGTDASRRAHKDYDGCGRPSRPERSCRSTGFRAVVLLPNAQIAELIGYGAEGRIQLATAVAVEVVAG